MRSLDLRQMKVACKSRLNSGKVLSVSKQSQLDAMPQFFSSPFLNFESIRILGTTRYGGADVAEALEAIGEINERDSDPSQSWHQAWSKQAQHAETLALEAQRHGNRSAAKSAFLRASNYTRASGYLMTGPAFGTSDPRVIPILQKSTELFQSALRLFDAPVKKLEIPYIHNNGKKVNLPAYLYLPNTSAAAATQTGPENGKESEKPKVPLLINLIGADSTQEEIYHMFPVAGPELGYAVLTYEGPGQGNTLHEESIPMRPDWEVVNNVVVDYILSYAAGPESETDAVQLHVDRIAVAGATLGGYYALRSAAGSTTDKRTNQNRIKACVAIDPIYNFYEMVRNLVAPTFFGLWERGWIPDWVINTAVLQGTRWAFQMRWEVFTSARFLGVSSSPADLLRVMRGYTMDKQEGGQEGSCCLRDVGCPTLVTAARASIYGLGTKDTGPADRFAQIGAEKKELWVGETLGGGGLQAKMGALGLCNQRAFEFLDRQFAIKRASV